MTQDELDKLPDVTDRKCAIFQREQDGVVQDVLGDWWMTGMLDGKPVKRRFGFSGAADQTTTSQP